MTVVRQMLSLQSFMVIGRQRKIAERPWWKSSMSIVGGHSLPLVAIFLVLENVKARHTVEKGRFRPSHAPYVEIAPVTRLGANCVARPPILWWWPLIDHSCIQGRQDSVRPNSLSSPTLGEVSIGEKDIWELMRSDV